MKNTVTSPAAEAEARQQALAEQKAFETLRDVSSAFWLSRCLHVVADLGVADVLGDTPETLESLAAAVDADTRALGRVLRLLAAHGIFDDRGGGRFAHTPTSRLLRDDHPKSARPFVRMLGLAVIWRSFGNLEHSVRTGEPGLEEIEPGGIFEYWNEHPAEARIFQAAMTAKAGGDVAGVTAAYDFSRFDTIADIGGGRGHLLRAVLDTAPNANGVLFDLPTVVADVAVDPPERFRLEAGDFFLDALPACDAYMLMDVLHDWSDDEVEVILANLRRAAPAGAVVLVIEHIIGEDPGPDWGKMLDINMLANTGGRERTRGEYEELFRAAGFHLQRVIPTGAAAIVEAVAV